MWGELGFAWLLLVALGTHGGWWLHGRSGQTRGLTHRGLVVHPTFLLLLALTQALRVGGRGLSGCSGVLVCPCDDGVENPEFHGLGYWSCFSWALSPAPCRGAFNSAGSTCVFIS